MRQLFDPRQIRAILETDRRWSLYALGDLDPPLFDECRWFADDAETALVLLYEGFDSPVLLAVGAADPLADILRRLERPQRAYLHIPTHVLPVVRSWYSVEDELHMQRMTLAAADFNPAETHGAKRLTADDLPALRRLYADGDAAGEAPDFFAETMLGSGVYFGVEQDGALIAAGGTHLLSQTESVAGVGNIYTRRDARRRGLAARVTTAVTAELQRMNIRTIGLNVAQRNTTAVRLYKRLGFRTYCPFVEGLATLQA